MDQIRFEDKIEVINEAIKKRRSKWQLKAVTHVSIEDVEQILRIHIYDKWHKWDQTRDLKPWLNAVISNRMKNLSRDLYKNFSRPCLNCSANEGGNLCSIYKTQNAECPLYAKWIKTKKKAHDLKLPLPLENHQAEVDSLSDKFIDFDRGVEIIHSKVMSRLTKNKKILYELLYIKGKDEDEVAKVMGYKAIKDKRKKIRYKQIENHKNYFLKLAKEIIDEEGLN